MRRRFNDQPRWPRGTPVAPGGEGPGGGRWRGDGPDASGLGGDWADQLSARTLPSLRGLMEQYAEIPRLDKIRGPEDPPWGRKTPEDHPVFQAEAAHHERLTAVAKRLLEGITSRDGSLRVADVSAHQLGGTRSWQRWVNEDGTLQEDTLEGATVFHPLGHVSIDGAIVGPQGEDRGYFRITASLDDGPGEDGKWEVYVDRFYVHLGHEEGGHRASFGEGDQSLRPGHGGGLATEVLQRVANWARESGFDRMAIGPSDTGFYAWPALGFDFRDLESRKVTFEGLMTISPADLEKMGFSRAAAVRGAARAKLIAAQVIAGTMSAHRLSQLGRKEGQGRDDMWLGKALMLIAGMGGGTYDLRRTRGRL